MCPLCIIFAYVNACVPDTLHPSSDECGGFIECLNGFQYIIHMAWHLETAPFFLDKAISANQESAALNALDLLAVHDFVFHDAEHVTHFFFSVGDQFKGECQFCFELVVGFHVVTRHAKHGSASFHKVFVFIPELHGFCSTAWRIIFRVEVQNDDFSEVGGVGDSDATSGIRFKVGDGFIDNNRQSS